MDEIICFIFLHPIAFLKHHESWYCQEIIVIVSQLSKISSSVETEGAN